MVKTNALETLHTALIDTRKGYDEAIADADAPHMKALFKDVQALHAEAHVDIHRLLDQRGVAPSEKGSLMGKVHEVVIGVRSALGGLDKASLASFASGEEHNLARYDAAIAESEDVEVGSLLTRHRGSLSAMVDRMKGAA